MEQLNKNIDHKALLIIKHDCIFLVIIACTIAMKNRWKKKVEYLSKDV